MDSDSSTAKEPSETMEVDEYEIDPEIVAMTTDELMDRNMAIQLEIGYLKSEIDILTYQISSMERNIGDNEKNVKRMCKLPYLVSNVNEVIDLPEDTEVAEEMTKPKPRAVIKTSGRMIVYLPEIGYVDAKDLKPCDLIGVNKDNFLIMEKLPPEYDSRVMAMEVDERPTEQFTDVGGCDKQIQEIKEAVLLPILHKERFKKLGITPPKGVLLYGPPGTGKTMIARAVAAQTNSTFLKLAATQLVQMYIGDGAKLVRDAFALAKEKAPTIMFIDELDAIGSKRFSSHKSGDREAQRTLLELLSQLDGFQPNDDVKLIAATNRVDILDPALMRSGRIDRKIEFPLPNEEARSQIMSIHTRKMTVSSDVNFDELARCTDGFNGAQCKAVCVEAGMIALRRNATELKHEDFMDGILEVESKKRKTLSYYA